MEKLTDVISVEYVQSGMQDFVAHVELQIEPEVEGRGGGAVVHGSCRWICGDFDVLNDNFVRVLMQSEGTQASTRVGFSLN